MKSQDHHDVKQYKKSCEERDRRSLQYRGKKFALEKLEERLEKAEAQSKAHESFELKSESWRDVQEYIKDCKKRKRKSLALRAKEKRSHMEWAQREKERALQETSRDVNSRLWDRRHVELAKQTERAKAAADALRNAGVVLKGNPFSSLLE
uniref:Uncharacterized protein n=1 Tax=Craspedostauros australis TaxID=1486917 RepID=A0A7R9ZT96_9STRA